MRRVAVVGVGGVGGYFGGRLAQAGHCHVHFIARGATFQALREGGLRVDSINGDFRIDRASILVSDVSESLPPMDLVLVAVKGEETFKALLPSLKRIVSDHTTVLPLQNGVEAPYLLMEALGKEKVLGGYCKIVSRIKTPGHILHEASEPAVGLGEITTEKNGKVQGTSTRVKQIAELFEKSGIKVELPEDIRVGLWHKLMLIAGISGVGACTRAPLDVNLQIPETREMLRSVLYEVVHVAQAQGIALPLEAADQVLQHFINVTKTSKGATSSMQRDVLKGLPSELYWLTGAVVRRGKELGVPTPVNDCIIAILLPQEKKARKEVEFNIVPSNL